MSIVSRRAKASEYCPAPTNSSIWASHDFILNCQIVLPSVAAAALSVGVVTRKSGDLAEADGVSNRTVAFVVGGEESVEVDDEGWLKGKKRVCVGSKDIEERI